MTFTNRTRHGIALMRRFSASKSNLLTLGHARGAIAQSGTKIKTTDMRVEVILCPSQDAGSTPAGSTQVFPPERNSQENPDHSGFLRFRFLLLPD